MVLDHDDETKEAARVSKFVCYEKLVCKDETDTIRQCCDFSLGAPKSPSESPLSVSFLCLCVLAADNDDNDDDDYCFFKRYAEIASHIKYQQ